MINGFRPAAGDVFAVLNYGSRAGMFARTNGLSLGNGLSLTPAYGPRGFTLTATGSVVAPPTLTFSRDAGGLLDCTDPASATLPWRFYRAVVP